METLKGQVNVLREIALRRPNAHLAFLFHAPYCALYNNKGQQIEFAKHVIEVKEHYTIYRTKSHILLYNLNYGFIHNITREIYDAYYTKDDEYTICFNDHSRWSFTRASRNVHKALIYLTNEILPHVAAAAINRKRIV